MQSTRLAIKVIDIFRQGSTCCVVCADFVEQRLNSKKPLHCALILLQVDLTEGTAGSLFLLFFSC